MDDTPGWDSHIKRTGALVICFAKNRYQDPVLWGCEDILVPILKQHIIWLNTLKEGCTGVGGGGVLWHSSQMVKIKDHGSKNFVFPNHENKQVRCSF